MESLIEDKICITLGSALTSSEIFQNAGVDVGRKIAGHALRLCTGVSAVTYVEFYHQIYSTVMVLRQFIVYSCPECLWWS